jgi:hypothetical protein
MILRKCGCLERATRRVRSEQSAHSNRGRASVPSLAGPVGQAWAETWNAWTLDLVAMGRQMNTVSNSKRFATPLLLARRCPPYVRNHRGASTHSYAA